MVVQIKARRRRRWWKIEGTPIDMADGSSTDHKRP